MRSGSRRWRSLMRKKALELDAKSSGACAESSYALKNWGTIKNRSIASNARPSSIQIFLPRGNIAGNWKCRTATIRQRSTRSRAHSKLIRQLAPWKTRRMLSPSRAHRQGGTRPSGTRTISGNALNGHGRSAVEKAKRTLSESHPTEFSIECFESNVAVHAAEFPFRRALPEGGCLKRFDATFFDPIFPKSLVMFPCRVSASRLILAAPGRMARIPPLVIARSSENSISSHQS